RPATARVSIVCASSSARRPAGGSSDARCTSWRRARARGRRTITPPTKRRSISLKAPARSDPAADAAHRLANTSDKPLRYLCFSTMIEPEVTVYPDSNKIGISVGAAPGGPREKRTLAKSLRADAEVDYWDGER